jgi:ParB family transcriptional regulator, chromosome partitioning protein
MEGNALRVAAAKEVTALPDGWSSGCDFRRGEIGMAAATATAVMIPVERLAESRFNPRRASDDAAEARLAASIIALGILQPLVVRPSPDNPVRYEVAAGNRRLRAVKAAIAAGRLAADFEFPCLVAS